MLGWEDVREDDPQIHQYSPAGDKLFEVYGDTVHRNTGDHMPGGLISLRMLSGGGSIER